MSLLGLELAARRPARATGRLTISRLGAPLLHAHEARTFRARLRGLHALPPLGPTDALVIRPCRAIHTFRMARAIDVAFLDREGAILRVETVPPGSARLCVSARVVIEMASGTAARLGLGPGQVLLPPGGSWR